MSTVLALAAHPDDMEIGCGGTMAIYAERGARVHVFVATDGSKGGAASVRRVEQTEAARVLGVDAVHWGGFEDTALSAAADRLIASIEKLVTQLEPDIVFVNHYVDTHQDHRMLARAAHSATRFVPNLLSYETPTSYEFDPSVYMDIGSAMDKKRKALKAHASQVERTNVQGLNILDIAEATAHFRGLHSRLNSAEAFIPIRMRL